LIVVPQLLVALLMPWVGRSAEKHGRKPLLLVEFAALPICAVLFALISKPLALVVIQLLDVIPGIGRSDDGSGHRRCNEGQSRAGMFRTVMGAPLSVRPFRV
jgi:MFS family permease